MIPRVVLALVLIGAAAGAAAQDPPPDEGAPAPELREAVRDAYLAHLRERLALSPEKAREVEPLILAALDAREKAGRTSRDLKRRVAVAAEAGATDAEGRDAVAALLDHEAAAPRHIQSARDAMAAALAPRQAALALTLDEPVRQRLRAIAAQRGGLEGGAPPPGAPHGPPRDEPDPARAAEWKDTLRLVMAHEARTALALDDARTLALLPRIDGLLAAREEALKQHRRSQRELARLAEDPGASDADVRKAVGESGRSEVAAMEAVVASRRELVKGLSGREAATLLALEARLERDLGRRLAGQARGGGQGPGGRPGWGGAQGGPGGRRRGVPPRP